jgi:sugar lactone lactonase YvrE
MTYRAVCAALACAAAALLAADRPLAQSKAKAQNVPDIPYESVANFFKMPPNIYFGEGIGVATNSKGHVFVYTRSGETRLFQFDEKGAFVRELGQGLYGFVFAHAVRVDKDDNIWAVDEGSNMVIKFNPQGRVVMVLGRRPEAVDELTAMPGQGAYTGANKPYVFNRPTDVGWDPAGNIFVADGYGESRVVKYDRNGRFIKSAGVRGNQNGELNLPHTLALDAHGNVYVGDRSNARIQVWDNDLTFKAIYDQVGSPWAICISPGPHQYLFVSNSVPDNGDSRLAVQTGEIYKMELDGTIIGKFGRAGKALKEFSTVHEIDCRNPNELLVSEITSWRVQKIILRPPASTASGR